MFYTAPNVPTLTDTPSRLEPISWQDVFATTLYENQEIDVGNVVAAATLPTPASPSRVVQPWSGALVNPPLAGIENNLPGFTHEKTSVSLENHDTSDRWPEQATTERSGIPLAVFKDKNIDLLSDLSANLLKDLHCITTYESASSFLLTHSDSTAAEYIFQTMECTTSSDYTIEKMLRGTEKFLEALHSLNQPLNHACPDSEHPTDAEMGNFGEPEGITGSSLTDPESRMEERWRYIETVLNRTTHVASDGSTGSLPGGKEGRPQPKREAPSTFALLTCYVCLIKIYESVFTIIHLSFEASRKWTLFPKLPQTITGLRINDFLLQNHHDLQIKILIQVSTHMLDSVEKALGGMLSSPLFQALLKSSLQQEGYSPSTNDETGTKIVRELMKKIEDLCSNSD